jgi:hypothetical protein
VWVSDIAKNLIPLHDVPLQQAPGRNKLVVPPLQWNHPMPTPANLPPSILSHVSIGTNDYSRAKVFYDAVLATSQIGVVMEHAGMAVAYGRAFPEF